MSSENAAPRITPAELEAEIASEHYFTASDGVLSVLFSQADGDPAKVTIDAEALSHLELLTFCVLILRNGCKVVGINYGPVVPDGFDPVYGREDARRDAIRQVWPLLGFRLRDKLARQAQEQAGNDLRSEIEGYLAAAAEGAMSRNNSENLAGELLEKLRSGAPRAKQAPVDYSHLRALRWHMEYIDNVDEDLREWEAPSILHEDLSSFYYRIRETPNPQARFVEASDAELMSGAPRTWPTIEEAQAALQKDHEEAIKAARAEQA